jgi:hypothetical protein
MRVNVYTEELIKLNPNEDCQPHIADRQPIIAQIVTADYISSRTGEPMKNYGLRIFLKSAPELHYIPGRDDDRSAVTIWCGAKERYVFEFLELIRDQAYQSTLDIWRDKTLKQQAEAEAAIEKNRE